MDPTLQFPFEVEHPDRVAWYLALIEEWTGQVPAFLPSEDGVIASVQPYRSSAGTLHAVPTYAQGVTNEAALEQLVFYVYEDVQADYASVSVLALV